MWSSEANESEPLMRCRKRLDDVETGVSDKSRDKSGGEPVTGQAASGIQVARLKIRLLHGTREPVVLMRRERPQAEDLQGPEYRGKTQGRRVP